MPKILLAEDDPMIADIYERKFLSSGFEIAIASTGKEVLRKASESAFDLILLDLVLPEMEGMDVLKELRTDPSYDAELKIIIFSNLNDRDIRQKAVELGANGFITKAEYSPSRLVDEVGKFLYQFEEQKKNADRIQNGIVPKNKRILLVEDEDVFADMFGKRLRDEGYEVEIAFNGADGFKKASESESAFDLIITDMVMPGLNGQELIRKLKEDEKTKSVPVFLFSASVEDSVLNGAQCDGADKCFKKTHITPSELTREVNKFLGE